jgi:hypothetical protein
MKFPAHFECEQNFEAGKSTPSAFSFFFSLPERQQEIEFSSLAKM